MKAEFILGEMSLVGKTSKHNKLGLSCPSFFLKNYNAAKISRRFVKTLDQKGLGQCTLYGWRKRFKNGDWDCRPARGDRVYWDSKDKNGLLQLRMLFTKPKFRVQEVC